MTVQELLDWLSTMPLDGVVHPQRLAVEYDSRIHFNYRMEGDKVVYFPRKELKRIDWN